MASKKLRTVAGTVAAALTFAFGTAAALACDEEPSCPIRVPHKHHKPQQGDTTNNTNKNDTAVYTNTQARSNANASGTGSAEATTGSQYMSTGPITVGGDTYKNVVAAAANMPNLSTQERHAVYAGMCTENHQKGGASFSLGFSPHGTGNGGGGLGWGGTSDTYPNEDCLKLQEKIRTAEFQSNEQIAKTNTMGAVASNVVLKQDVGCAPAIRLVGFVGDKDASEIAALCGKPVTQGKRGKTQKTQQKASKEVTTVCVPGSKDPGCLEMLAKQSEEVGKYKEKSARLQAELDATKGTNGGPATGNTPKFLQSPTANP